MRDRELLNRPSEEGLAIDSQKNSRGITVAAISFIRIVEEHLREFLLVLVLIGLVIILGIVSPHFFSLRNLNAILAVSAFLGTIAIGQTLVMISGGMDLSIGYVSGFGGILCAILLNNGFNAALAVLCVLFMGAVIGLFNGLVINRLHVNDFITTLSTMTIVTGLIYTSTKGNSVPVDNEFIRAIGSTAGGIKSWPVIGMIILIIIFQIVLSRTRFGRHIYAVGGNLRAAKLAGINTESLKTATYMISGVLSSFVGILVAGRMNTAQPQAGSGFLFDVITAVVLGGVMLNGGTGTLFGTLIGVLLVAVLGAGVTMSGLAYYYQSILKGFLLIAAIAITNRRSFQNTS